MGMNLGDTALGDIHQTQKDKSCVILLTGGPWRGHIQRDRKSTVGPGAGRGCGGQSGRWGRVSVWKDRDLLEADGVMFQHVLNATELCT